MVEGALVVVVVVGVHCAFGASGCRDVDEARILVRQLHITMACPMHSYRSLGRLNPTYPRLGFGAWQ